MAHKLGDVQPGGAGLRASPGGFTILRLSQSASTTPSSTVPSPRPIRIADAGRFGTRHRTDGLFASDHWGLWVDLTIA